MHQNTPGVNLATKMSIYFLKSAETKLFLIYYCSATFPVNSQMFILHINDAICFIFHVSFSIRIQFSRTKISSISKFRFSNL